MPITPTQIGDWKGRYPRGYLPRIHKVKKNMLMSADGKEPASTDTNPSQLSKKRVDFWA